MKGTEPEASIERLDNGNWIFWNRHGNVDGVVVKDLDFWLWDVQPYKTARESLYKVSPAERLRFKNERGLQSVSPHKWDEGTILLACAEFDVIPETRAPARRTPSEKRKVRKEWRAVRAEHEDAARVIDEAFAAARQKPTGEKVNAMILIREIDRSDFDALASLMKTL